MSGPYAAYVLGGYVVSAAALGVTVLLTLRAWLRARRRLSLLESQAETRR